MKLPRLPAAEYAQAFGINLVIVKIDHADGSQVLLDPRILDDLWQNAIEPLGEIAEWTMRGFLNMNDMLHLRFSEPRPARLTVGRFGLLAIDSPPACIAFPIAIGRKPEAGLVRSVI